MPQKSNNPSDPNQHAGSPIPQDQDDDFDDEDEADEDEEVEEV